VVKTNETHLPDLLKEEAERYSKELLLVQKIKKFEEATLEAWRNQDINYRVGKRAKFTDLTIKDNI
jgi:hypothetical protein